MKRATWTIPVAVLVLLALAVGSFALGRWSTTWNRGPGDPSVVDTAGTPGVKGLTLGHDGGLQKVTVVVDEHWKVQDPVELARWASAVAWNRTHPASGDMDMTVQLVSATSAWDVAPQGYFGYLGWFEPVPPTYTKDSGSTVPTVTPVPLPTETPGEFSPSADPSAQPSGGETINWDPQPRGALLGLTPSGNDITLRTERNAGAIDTYYPGANRPSVSLATYWSQVFTTATTRDRAVAEELAPNALVKVS